MGRSSFADFLISSVQAGPDTERHEAANLTHLRGERVVDVMCGILAGEGFLRVDACFRGFGLLVSAPRVVSDTIMWLHSHLLGFLFSVLFQNPPCI